MNSSIFTGVFIFVFFESLSLINSLTQCTVFGGSLFFTIILFGFWFRIPHKDKLSFFRFEFKSLSKLHVLPLLIILLITFF